MASCSAVSQSSRQGVDVIYRVLYREQGDWRLHTGQRGTNIYTTLPAAKSAITHFQKRDRYYDYSGREYKIQSSAVNWADL